MNLILQCLCEYYNLRPENIFANNREYESTIVYRHLLVYLLRKDSHYTTYEMIRNFFIENGIKQHHATLMNGVTKTENRVLTEKRFAKEVKDIQNTIKDSKLPKIVIRDIDLLASCRPMYINQSA